MFETASSIILEVIMKSEPVMSPIGLDCDQTGWGLTPVIGLDAKLGKLNIGAKYEFKTNLNIENSTKENTHPNDVLAAFKHGVNTPNDIPSLCQKLLLAVSHSCILIVKEVIFYRCAEASYLDISAPAATAFFLSVSVILFRRKYTIRFIKVRVRSHTRNCLRWKMSVAMK